MPNIFKTLVYVSVFTIPFNIYSNSNQDNVPKLLELNAEDACIVYKNKTGKTSLSYRVFQLAT